MRISDWSSDVCSSDLTNPVRPELVEGPSFLLTSLKEGRGFDKLSPNGRENASPLRPYILAERIAQAIGETRLASVEEGFRHVDIFADPRPDRPRAARDPLLSAGAQDRLKRAVAPLPRPACSEPRGRASLVCGKRV